jgi:uracil-DNA glycosylase
MIPMHEDHIQHFINALSQAETAPDAYNEYAHGPPLNAIRRQNLCRYLQMMTAHGPSTLLVMEAPGYRGCRLTGVPVTSRKLLLEGVPELDLFGRDRGFQDVPESGFERIQGEQSATIVWGTLAQIGQRPLIWNTFPFHPHRPGEALSNRRPRSAEIAQGQTFLATLIEAFAPKHIIAVGNVAHESLVSLGIDCPKVRHPAQGGKNDFVAGLTALLNSAEL